MHGVKQPVHESAPLLRLVASCATSRKYPYLPKFGLKYTISVYETLRVSLVDKEQSQHRQQHLTAHRGRLVNSWRKYIRIWRCRWYQPLTPDLCCRCSSHTRMQFALVKRALNLNDKQCKSSNLQSVMNTTFPKHTARMVNAVPFERLCPPSMARFLCQPQAKHYYGKEEDRKTRGSCDQAVRTTANETEWRELKR